MLQRAHVGLEVAGSPAASQAVAKSGDVFGGIAAGWQPFLVNQAWPAVPALEEHADRPSRLDPAAKTDQHHLGEDSQYVGGRAGVPEARA